MKIISAGYTNILNIFKTFVLNGLSISISWNLTTFSHFYLNISILSFIWTYFVIISTKSTTVWCHVAYDAWWQHPVLLCEWWICIQGLILGMEILESPWISFTIFEALGSPVIYQNWRSPGKSWKKPLF